MSKSIEERLAALERRDVMYGPITLGGPCNLCGRPNHMPLSCEDQAKADQAQAQRLVDAIKQSIKRKESIVVRAKFSVNAITRTMGSKKSDEKDSGGRFIYKPCEMWTIKMSPVYGNGDPAHENTKFWDASPGGSFELNCVNAEAVKQFELGKEYYFDISVA